MRLSFVKIHLIIFEVVSSLLLAGIFIALFYYSIFYKSYAAFKEDAERDNEMEAIHIKFIASYSKGVFSDVDVKIYDPEDDTISGKDAYIVVSNSYYDRKSHKKIIKELSEETIHNIFLFQNETIAENFKHHIHNLRKEASTFNLTLFILISFYLIFLKITILKDNISKLKKMKSSKSDGKNEKISNLLAQIHPEEYALSQGREEQQNLYYNPILTFMNPINVYYYVIFNLTIVIIIPFIFPNYVEFYVSSYFSFMSNLSYSVYYRRALFGVDGLKKDFVDPDKMIVPVKADEQEKLFMVHDYLDLEEYSASNTNPYVMNLLIMCGSIWLSQLFHPFDSQTAVKIADVDLKHGKIKRYIKLGAIIAVFCVWGYFLVYGLLYQLDLFYLFNRLLFNNIKRILDIKVLGYILIFLYHIYFYSIMVFYTIQIHQKNKRYRGNQKVIYKWFA